jgi:protein TonB
MDKKIAIELIKLEVLNNSNKQDEEALNYLKKNFEEFPWKDYGDYQNLAAVLAVSEKLQQPSEQIKQNLISEARELKNTGNEVSDIESASGKEIPALNLYTKSRENSIKNDITAYDNDIIPSKKEIKLVKESESSELEKENSNNSLKETVKKSSQVKAETSLMEEIIPSNTIKTQPDVFKPEIDISRSLSKNFIAEETINDTTTANDKIIIEDPTIPKKDMLPGNGKSILPKEEELRNDHEEFQLNTTEPLSDFTLSSVDIDIEKEIEKIELELKKDLDEIKQQFSDNIASTRKTTQSSKKEYVSFREPDLLKVRSFLRESAKESYREKRSTQDTTSIKPENVDSGIDKLTDVEIIPEDIRTEIKNSENVNDDKKKVTQPNNTIYKSEAETVSNINKPQVGRREKRGLVLISGIILIAVPIIFFFVFPNNSDSSKNTDTKNSIKETSVAGVGHVQTDLTQDVIITEETAIDSVVTDIVEEDIKLPEENTEITSSQKQDIKESQIEDNQEVLASSETIKENIQAINEIPIAPIGQMKKEEEENPYFVAVEEMPEPIGGIAEIQKKVIYPSIASAAGIEGKVIINAFVDEYGNVTKTELIKGIGHGCDEAAAEAIRNTMFKPGKQRGKPVKVKITIPVVFKQL